MLYISAKLVILLWAVFVAVSSASRNVELNITELCALAPNSTIRRPNSCTDWFKCPSTSEALDADQGTCVHGLYFNKNSGKCEDKYKVPCEFANYTVSGKNRCNESTENLFMADERSCNGYIYCHKGEERKSMCPNNLVFDAVKKACVYSHQYECPDRKAKAESDVICRSLKDGWYFADRDDCTKYNFCNKGVLERRSCNSSYAWSYVERKCVPADNVTCYPKAKKPEPEVKVCVDRVGPVSDEVTCSGYYFCKKVNGTHDRKPEHFTCDPGKFFDSGTLSCRDRVNVKCSLDRCEGMGNKYVNIAGDCRAYALCSNNKINTKGLCPNTHYFDERTQGCTSQVVNYAACAA